MNKNSLKNDIKYNQSKLNICIQELYFIVRMIEGTNDLYYTNIIKEEYLLYKISL